MADKPESTITGIKRRLNERMSGSEKAWVGLSKASADFVMEGSKCTMVEYHGHRFGIKKIELLVKVATVV